MASFKVLEVNEEKKWVSIEVTFDDSTTYTKRMMVSNVDEESVKADVEKWLKDYEPARVSEKDKPVVTKVALNKKITIVPKSPIESEEV